ncbi:MAG: cobalamin biosynthesis protein CobD [Cyanobacteria bacterium K_Offshore_surface_m2_239]|nr:cobalamin biosynthesis protein CobD [Cyanobacteria bacterium K_Offshore_surface_m2_239]
MISGGTVSFDQPVALVLLACGLDQLLGDPRWCLHPVQVMGWFIERLRQLAERWAGDVPWKLRLSGLLLCLLLVTGSAGAGVVVERWAEGSPAPLGGTVLVVALASALAGGSLDRAVRGVLRALPDEEEARGRLALIVGREVEGLPEAEIVRAAAETAAENAVDGLFAPLFWILVGMAGTLWSGSTAPGSTAPGSMALSWALGPLALAWAFKASSTLDSMLGYRRGRLRWLGTAGARLDDGLTWLPARLVALTLPLVGRQPWRFWSAFRLALREGAADPSPNAGVSQAAYAEVAGVRLGGRNRYADGWRWKPVVGADHPAVDRHGVERMLRLTTRLEILWLVGVMVMVAAGNALRR